MGLKQKLRNLRAGRVSTLLVGVFVAGALAGCGGGEDEDVSRNDFIAEADAICVQFASDSAALEQEFNQALQDSDLETAAQDFEDQATEVTAMLDQLEELSPPVADQTLMDQMIALGRERVDVAKKAADAIASGDKDQMIAAGKQGSVLAGEYYQMADSFGFDSCGSGGASGTGNSGATGSTGTSDSAS